MAVTAASREDNIDVLLPRGKQTVTDCDHMTPSYPDFSSVTQLIVFSKHRWVPDSRTSC